ncbi:histidine phosphatase family protein [Candidatus Poribacteria bacterium]|nr:histidine phosphatase family protein [Candidatus Poribacteria bacterium]
MSHEFRATALILIRHGQARASDGSYNRETPLSELGRLPAAAIASKIVASTPPVAVYTSPYPRAVDTAAPLCEKLGLKPFVDPRLAEFELAPYSLESVQQRPDLVIWHPNHRGVANGETLGEFSARVADFCDEIVQKHLGDCVAVIAHAGTIDAAIRWSVGLGPASAWQHEFDLANGSITELEFWPQGRVPGGAPRYAVLRCVGDVAHLGDLISDL